MFKKLMDKINNKSIELYVKNETAEEVKPRELKITIKLLSLEIVLFFIFLCMIDVAFYATGNDNLSMFGLTYGELLLNYLIVLFVENVWGYFMDKKPTVKTTKDTTPPTA